MSYIKYFKNDIIKKSINEKWKGDGTLENPFLIESPHSFSQQSVIKDTSLHIILKNCSFTYLTLNKCKNIKFEHCTFEVLYLLKCSDIMIKNCPFNLKLDLTKCHHIQVFDSSIPFLEFFRCYDTHFQVCTINKIHNYFSRGNLFEHITTPILDYESLMNKFPKQYYSKFLPYPIVGIILLMLSIVRFSNNITSLQLWSFIGAIFLLVSFVCIFVLVISLDYKKMKKYSPNRFL